MFSICSPAIIYIIFSLTQVIIDIYKGLFNTALVKFFVMIMVTMLLNILCEKGLSMVSWIIVFIPFILMTVIVTLLLYFFGLNATTGTIKNKISNINNVTKDINGNIIIYDPQYNSNTNPVYYSSPNIIVPNPYNKKNNITNTSPPVDYSSSPYYQS